VLPPVVMRGAGWRAAHPRSLLKVLRSDQNQA
jgi:hypothetical protein